MPTNMNPVNLIARSMLAMPSPLQNP